MANEQTDHHPRLSRSAFRARSAWVPIGLSAAAVALVASYIAMGPHAPYMINDHGVVREDEGAMAHLWQILMLLQVGGILAFAVLWWPRDVKRAAIMLSVQCLAVLCAAAPVYLMEHGYFS